ncbi:pYEATS domain-containing protein [Verrucomicrobium sp. BvORR106]|uniref:KGGVGR-motif variant AAA ATPase n=1 Tax=Verrucomicrobium sp. BvORR106 TaxID=1403819 RepID=UPI000571EC1A|nr:pYEATS domain-containing protein [Verrucomicrobium sp. BvORR106]
MPTRKKAPARKAKKVAPKMGLLVQPPPAVEIPERDRIFTFYSYKGGTGRSMALANVAWILASNRKRVLVIDWDLEAPGLHRYFRPFLQDPELLRSDGLIDFFCEFAEAARMQKRKQRQSEGQEEETESLWYEDYTDLLRCAVSLDHEFPSPGTIDFVPAGRQGPSYGIRVGSFDWTDFYQKLGGGVFLEAVKKQLLEDYDYILIDSRTGLSDTAGICTVQMPGELVVFFTLNRQSIMGAAAAAQSAVEQRRKGTGESTLRVWPVATRVDENEKERLEAARTMARETFAPFLQRTVMRKMRESYWAQVEIPYVPFYAYEEILATVADRPELRSSLLAAMLNLTQAITEGQIKKLPSLSSREQHNLRARYATFSENRTVTRPPKFYLSYCQRDVEEKTMRKIAGFLEMALGEESIVWDGKIPLAERWDLWLDRELEAATCVLFFVGPAWLESANTARELEIARSAGKALVPVIMHDTTEWSDLPKPLREVRGRTISQKTFKSDLEGLVQGLQPFTRSARQLKLASQPIDPDDPQRGRWGGRAMANGRRLTATVSAISKYWFEIKLVVSSTNKDPLKGRVNFHLHPSFEPDKEVVEVDDAKGEVYRVEAVLHAYGAFTVGVEADNGETQLELNLAKLPDAPKLFREH